MSFDALIGNWIITGDEYDTELEITKTTMTLKKGKNQQVFSYSSGNYPVINFKDSSGTSSSRYFFFFGKDILTIYLPSEGYAMMFKRKK